MTYIMSLLFQTENPFQNSHILIMLVSLLDCLARLASPINPLGSFEALRCKTVIYWFDLIESQKNIYLVV